VAAAATCPAGIDVEAMSDRPLRVARLFTSEEERRLASAGVLTPAEVALRAWSVKEAAAKAAGIPLATAWHRCRVLEFGRDRSIVALDGGKRFEAFHAAIDEHLFTLLVLAP
jgi:phosphopantetheinyl transferase